MPDAPMIRCPKCAGEFALDESLAGPLVRQAREEADAKLRQWQQEQVAERQKILERENEIAAQLRDLTEREAAYQARLNEAVATERAKIAAEERERAREELAPEREAELNRMKSLEAELEQSRATERALLRNQAALEERAQNLDLEVMRKLNEERATDTRPSTASNRLGYLDFFRESCLNGSRLKILAVVDEFKISPKLFEAH